MTIYLWWPQLPHKNAHALIIGTYEHVTFHVRRDFANVIMFIDFKIRELFWRTCMRSIKSHELKSRSYFLARGRDVVEEIAGKMLQRGKQNLRHR